MMVSTFFQIKLFWFFSLDQWSAVTSHVYTALSERAGHHSDLRLIFHWRVRVILLSFHQVRSFYKICGMWECAMAEINHREFPQYQDNKGAHVHKVPIPMVVLVAMVVSKPIYFITKLINNIAVHCPLWVAHWVPSADGIFLKFFPWCVSRPHWYIEPYPSGVELSIPSDDVWHLQSYTVSFLVDVVIVSTDRLL